MADFTGQNIQDTYQRVVQVDGNQLQDGTGSVLPISFNGDDVIIPGALRATSYIISQSTTIATSGSTIFGNSFDDTHVFSGSVNIGDRVNSNYNAINTSLFVRQDAVDRSQIANGFGGAIDFHTQRGSNANGSRTGRIASRLTTGAQTVSDFYALDFGIRSNDTQIDLMTLHTSNTNTAGRVGILDTTPSHTLDVNGTFRTTGPVILGDASSDAHTINGTVSQITSAGVISSSNKVHANTLVTDSGNIIGDTSEATQLVVNGFMTITGPITASSDISSSGNILSSNISSLTTTTGSLLNSIDAVSVTTASLLNSIDAISVTTGSLLSHQSRLINSVDAISVTTGSLLDSINVISVTTASLLNSIDTISVTTASLLNSVDAISVTTGSLLNSVDAISIVTGSYAITGSDVTFNSIELNGSITASGVIMGDTNVISLGDPDANVGGVRVIINQNGTTQLLGNATLDLKGNTINIDSDSGGTAKINLLGTVTASSDISSSGAVIGATGSFGRGNFDDVLLAQNIIKLNTNNNFLQGKETGGTSRNILGINTSDVIQIANANLETDIKGTNITLNAPITASGNISSSGTVEASGYKGTKHILRAMSFYVNDDPLIQNSLYFGGTLGHQNSNWNDPQAVGGAISSTNSFTIVEDDMNWGIILPFDVSEIEIQCSLRPGGACTDEDFTAALYTANRSDNDNTAITLTKVAHSQTLFKQGKYVTNDFTHTANLDKGTMIYVGVGTEDSSPAAKNARGIMNITATQR